MSETTPPATRSPIPQWAKAVLVVSAILVSGAIWLGRRSMMGTELMISDQEAINYSGTATEAEAKALGTALQTMGIFDGKSEKDVLFKKGEDGIVVSFVMQGGQWNDPETVSTFEIVGRQIAGVVGGPPITVKLLDGNLNTEKELPIAVADYKLKISDKETVNYSTPITEAEAAALGKALQEAGYFRGEDEIEVALKQEGQVKSISFVVTDGTWDKPDMVAAFEEIGRTVAPSIGGPPLKIHMVDTNSQPRKSMDITE